MTLLDIWKSTLTRTKTAWKNVQNYWQDEKSWHNRTATKVKNWWENSYLKRGYGWVGLKLNRLMEASIPFSRTINFLKNWMQGFVFIWGVMMVNALAADPMIILAGGALAISNVAFAAAILIAFAYAYYHYRVEKNQVAIAEKQTLNEAEITKLKRDVAQLKEQPSPIQEMSERLATLEAKNNALQEQLSKLDASDQAQTVFLANYGYEFSQNKDAEPSDVSYSQQSSAPPQSSSQCPSYIN
jgi:hypothetical protein